MKRFAIIALCVAFAICGVNGNDKVAQSVENAKIAVKKARDDYSTALNDYLNTSITFITLQREVDERVAKIDEVAKAIQNGGAQRQKIGSIMQKIQGLEMELQESYIALQSAKKHDKSAKKYITTADRFIDLSEKSTKELLQSKATLDNAIAVFRKYAK